jgi:spore coat protein U-like protein
VVTNARFMRPGLRTAAVLLASASFGLASLASAQSPASPESGTMAVSAAVTANCHLTTVAIDFGSIDVTLGGVTDQPGSFSLQCTNGTDYTVTADKGQGGAAATISARQLTGSNDSTNKLSYSLFKDTTHATVWGDGTDGVAFTGTGDGTPHSTDFYGRVFGSQQNAKTDSYADTIAVTVTY